MQRDLGSRSPEFIEILDSIRKDLIHAADLRPEDGYTVVPIQGSGTYALESVLLSLLGPEDSLLVLENGEYGKRLGNIVRQAGRSVVSISCDPLMPLHPQMVQKALEENANINAIALVHCETTTGIVNPVDSITKLAKAYKLTVVVDAMSSFGAIPLNIKNSIDCVVSSANKCLEGVPGFAFAIATEALLQQSADNSPSLSLDLYSQWRYLEAHGQFRFTPPTHAVLAFREALNLFLEEGGTAARALRYSKLQEHLVQRMETLNLRPLLDRSLQGPVITAFPGDRISSFESLYSYLAEKRLHIYPGKLANMKSFRIGTIGQLTKDDIDRLVTEMSRCKYLTHA